MDIVGGDVAAEVVGGGADSLGALLDLSPHFFFSAAKTSKMLYKYA